MRPSFRYGLRAVVLILLGLSALPTVRVHAQSVTASPTAGSAAGQINVTYSGAGSPQCVDAPFLVLLRNGPTSSLVAQGATDNSGNAQLTVTVPSGARPDQAAILVDFGPGRSACSTAGPITVAQAPSTPTTVPTATAVLAATPAGTTGPAATPISPTGAPGVAATLTPVPVVPEAESSALLGTGLLVVGALVAARELRRRRVGRAKAGRREEPVRSPRLSV